MESQVHPRYGPTLHNHVMVAYLDFAQTTVKGGLLDLPHGSFRSTGVVSNLSGLHTATAATYPSAIVCVHMKVYVDVYVNDVSIFNL